MLGLVNARNVSAAPSGDVTASRDVVPQALAVHVPKSNTVISICEIYFYAKFKSAVLYSMVTGLLDVLNTCDDETCSETNLQESGVRHSCLGQHYGLARLHHTAALPLRTSSLPCSDPHVPNPLLFGPDMIVDKFCCYFLVQNNSQSEVVRPPAPPAPDPHPLPSTVKNKKNIVI